MYTKERLAFSAQKPKMCSERGETAPGYRPPPKKADQITKKIQKSYFSWVCRSVPGFSQDMEDESLFARKMNPDASTQKWVKCLPEPILQVRLYRFDM